MRLRASANLRLGIGSSLLLAMRALTIPKSVSRPSAIHGSPFVNLASRCGDQSGPNNRGVASARRRYIAFLNHDDLYLPNHLATCVAELEASGADLVWVPCVAALPGIDSDKHGGRLRFELHGVPGCVGCISPVSFCSASSWVFRRSLAERIGPWPAAAEVYVSPSQAWLFRAWRSGAVLRFLPAVGVVLVPAWFRAGSSTSHKSPDHEWLARWFKSDSKYRERMLEAVAVSEAIEHITDVRHRPLRAVRRLMLCPIYAFLTARGIHPLSLFSAIRCGRRGGLIRRHRQRTGAS